MVIAVIKKLEMCGVKIHGVCDGATNNRKMWSEFGISGDLKKPMNKTLHPFCDERYLYFFSDVPHLIKCLRNRFFDKGTLVVGRP